MVEVANPSEDGYYLPEKYIGGNQNHSSEPDYYGSLEEKQGKKESRFKNQDSRQKMYRTHTLRLETTL